MPDSTGLEQSVSATCECTTPPDFPQCFGLRLEPRTARTTLASALDAGVCANSCIPDLLGEAFESRNVWSLFSAFTETLKQETGVVGGAAKRNQALHGLIDVHVGFGAI